MTRVGQRAKKRGEMRGVGVETDRHDILIRHSDPVATALIQWLITGEHTARKVAVDLAWQPGTPKPFP